MVPGNENPKHEDDAADFGNLHFFRGGPFYELQKRLHLIREERETLYLRAAIFVGLAWGVPGILSLLEGNAFGPFDEKPFFFHLTAWARLFIGIGVFVLMEPFVEKRLSWVIRQLVGTGLLDSGSKDDAASAITRALKRRDAKSAETICLAIAIVLSFLSALGLTGTSVSSWAIEQSGDSVSLTAAGWWGVVVSEPIFFFLLARSIWRIANWALLLRKLTNLNLKLVATHPDGYGGIGFICDFPNAYTPLVFALSCVNAAVVADLLIGDVLSPTKFALVTVVWLLFVLIVISLPQLAFTKSLSDLKDATLERASAQARRYQRAAERTVLGSNVAAEDSEATTTQDVADPAAIYAAAKKMPVFLFNRTTLLPVSAAALLPYVAAGAAKLPFEEIVRIFKRFLLL